MKFNWMYINANRERDRFIKFEDKNVIRGENSAGKSMLASYLLFPFSITHDLSKTRKKDQVIIEIEDNGKVAILRRSGETNFAVLINGKVERGSKETIYKRLFDYFEIQYYDSIKPFAMFMSLFNPGLILQSTKLERMGFVDFKYAPNDRTSYAYWANAFRDEFSNGKLIDNIHEHKEKLRDLEKREDKIKEILKFLSNFQWTSFLDEKMEQARRIGEEIVENRRKLIKLVADEIDLNKRLHIYKSISFQRTSLENKYKGALLVFDNVKVSFDDFLSKMISTSENDITNSNKLALELEKVSQEITVTKNKIAQLNNMQSEAMSHFNNVDYILMKSKKVSDIEIEKLDIESQMLRLKDVISALLKNLASIKTDINIYDEMSKHKTFKDDIEPKSKKESEYSWLKVSLKGKTGSKPILFILQLQKLAMEKRGFASPIIWDSAFDALSEENLKIAIEQAQSELFTSKQFIIFLHEINQQNMFDDKNWNIVDVSQLHDEINSEITEKIELLKM